MVEAAANGDLTQRIPLEGKDGFFQKLSEGLNALVSGASSILHDVGLTFSALAEGDLNRRITNDYKGEFNKIKETSNKWVDKLYIDEFSICVYCSNRTITNFTITN